MTLNARFKFQLKVRFADGTLDVRMLWLLQHYAGSFLTMRDWALTVSDKMSPICRGGDEPVWSC